MSRAKLGSHAKNPKFVIILIVGQVFIDVAIAVYFWIGSVWQSKVTDLLLGQGLL